MKRLSGYTPALGIGMTVVMLLAGCSALEQATVPDDSGTEGTGSDTTSGQPVTGGGGETTRGDGVDGTSDTTAGIVDGTSTGDDNGTTDNGTTDNGTTDNGTTDNGTTDGSTTDNGTTDGSTTDTGTTDGGTTDNGTTDNGTTDGSTTDTGTTDGSTTDTGTTDGSAGMACTPVGDAPFTDDSWSTYATANNTVTLVDATEVLLIPDDVTDAGAAIFYDTPLEMPYTVSFEYTIFDDDGAENGSVFNSADGLALFVANDVTPYGLSAPPAGSARGFFTDGTGYALDFEIYQFRQIRLRDGNGTTVAGPVTPAASTYPHGAWRSVVATVTPDGITVEYEGSVEITYAAALDETYDRVGFGAGTGGADGAHRIRNVSFGCPG